MGLQGSGHAPVLFGELKGTSTAISSFIAQGTGLEVNGGAVNVITEPKALGADTPLGCTGCNAIQLLDCVVSVVIIRIGLKN